jgi:hypothetical protein
VFGAPKTKGFGVQETEFPSTSKALLSNAQKLKILQAMIF